MTLHLANGNLTCLGKGCLLLRKIVEVLKGCGWVVDISLHIVYIYVHYAHTCTHTLFGHLESTYFSYFIITYSQ